MKSSANTLGEFGITLKFKSHIDSDTVILFLGMHPGETLYACPKGGMLNNDLAAQVTIDVI